MKFSQRLILCAVAPALLFITGLAASIWGLVSTQAQFDHYIRTEQARAASFNEMYAQGLQMGQALRNMVLDPANPKARQNLDTASSGYERAAAALVKGSEGTAFAKDLEVLASLRSAHSAAQNKVLALIATDASQAVGALNSEETPAWRALRAGLLKHLEDARGASEEAHATVNSDADRMIAFATALAVLASLVSAALCVFMQRTVGHELGGDPASTRTSLLHIASGDLSKSLILKEGDEQSLMHALGQM